MQEVQIWLLTGLMAVLLGIVGWVAKAAASGLMKKLDVMIEQLRNLAMSGQATSIKTDSNTVRIDGHERKLENHDERIQKLERFPISHTYHPSPNTEL